MKDCCRKECKELWDSLREWFLAEDNKDIGEYDDSSWLEEVEE